MNITTLSHSPGGSAAVPHDVNLSDVEQGMFQKTLYFRMMLPPGADRLVIGRGQTGFSIRFSPVVYNALGNSRAEMRASVRASFSHSRLILVEFPMPVLLSGIELLAHMGADPAFSIEIYRVDGDAVANEPSVTASCGVSGAEMAGGMGAASASAVYVSAASSASSYEVLSVDTDYAWGSAWSVSSIQYSCSIRGSAFAMRLVTPGGEAVSGFGTDWLSGLLVTGLPASPSISLVSPLPDPETGVIVPAASTSSLLHVQPGELGGDESPDPGVISLGEPFSKALHDALGRLGNCAGLNAEETVYLDFALEIKSGAPCAAVISNFSVEYFCAKQCLIGAGLEKKSLKFRGGVREEARALSIVLPPAGTVHQADLKVDVSLEGTSAVNVDSSPVSQDIAESSSEGVQGERGSVLEQPFELESASVVHALNLLLTVIEDNTILSVSLIREGTETGETIHVCRDSSLDIATWKWSAFKPQTPVLLDGGTYIISVEIHQGAIIWHTREKSHSYARRKDPQGISYEFKGRTAYYFFEKTGSLSADSDRLKGEGAPRAVVEKMELPLIEPQENHAESVMSYNMKDALSSALSEGVEEITIRFFSARRGLITVYAPEIVYDP